MADLKHRRRQAVQAYLKAPEEPAPADLLTVLAAAGQGRVATLLVAEDQQIWAKSDSELGEWRLLRQPEAGCQDLLDRAAVMACQAGAKGFVLEPGAMPEDAVCAAVFRYPLE